MTLQAYYDVVTREVTR